MGNGENKKSPFPKANRGLTVKRQPLKAVRKEYMKRKQKPKKKPVYEPFNEMAGLEMIEEDRRCEAPHYDINGTLDELLKLQEDLEDAIGWYDDFIYDDMESLRYGSSSDTSYLQNDRQRRQQLNCELRAVKEKIKMMKTNAKGLTAA